MDSRGIVINKISFKFIFFMNWEIHLKLIFATTVTKWKIGWVATIATASTGLSHKTVLDAVDWVF